MPLYRSRSVAIKSRWHDNAFRWLRKALHCAQNTPHNSTRVWAQLTQHLMVKMWSMARKFCAYFSKNVQSLRKSFILQKKAFDDVAHSIRLASCETGLRALLFAGTTHIDPLSAICRLIAAIRFSSNDSERWFRPVKEGVHHPAIVDIPIRYCQTQGSASGIYSSVNLALAASA